MPHRHKRMSGKARKKKQRKASRKKRLREK